MDAIWTAVQWHSWVLLPALIFCARVTDVSLATVRVILVSKGVRLWAALLGAIEVTVWLMAIGTVMRNMGNPLSYIAYAGGFAVGTYAGVGIEAWLSIGKVIVRIITQTDASALIAALQEKGFGLATIDAQGATGPVKITLTDRKHTATLLSLAELFNPKAFYTIEEVRSAHEGVYPQSGPGGSTLWGRVLGNTQDK